MSGPVPAAHPAGLCVARGDVVKVGGDYALGHQLGARAAPAGERGPARARARAFVIDDGHAASCSRSRLARLLGTLRSAVSADWSAGAASRGRRRTNARTMPAAI